MPLEDAQGRFRLLAVMIFSVLQNCGLVAESHVIDERSEWRNFGDRVGLTTMS